MDNNKERLGTAPLGKLMFQLAVPTVFAQIINMLYNMVDRIFVGQIPEVGKTALAGLGVSFPIILLVSAFSALVGMGGAPQAAIRMGKKDYEGAEKILGNAAVFLVIMALALCVVFQVFKEPVLMMFGASENTLPYAKDYLEIYLLGTVSVQLALGLNQFITCQGFSKEGMLTVLIGAVINIILDPILIRGLNMGVKGAAIATIFSQTVSAVWVVCFLCGRKSILRIRRETLRLDPAVLKPVLLLGISPFIMQSTECLVQLTFNTGMQTFGNDDYVSAMTVIFSLSQLLFLPMSGIAQGAVPIISYNYGAGNNRRVIRTFRLLLISIMTFTTGMSALFELFPHVFVALFISEEAVMEIAAHGMRIYFLGYLIFGAQMACQQTFLALGEARISMFLAMLRKLILLIPLAILLPRLDIWANRTDGLFWAEPISDILAVIATVLMFALNIRRILAKNQTGG